MSTPENHTRIDLRLVNQYKVTEKAYVFTIGRAGTLRSGMVALPKSIIKNPKFNNQGNKLYEADIPNWWLKNAERDEEYLFRSLKTIEEEEIND